MAGREIVWLRKADADFQAIHERFEERGEGSGDGLFQEVNSVLERVILFPEIGRAFEPPIRRVLIDHRTVRPLLRCGADENRHPRH